MSLFDDKYTRRYLTTQNYLGVFLKKEKKEIFFEIL